ncbi:hypothetical protein F5882DRAFT_525212 [Hyaloscypha sp. PMI_1271]|nr:hypothetical protein F5882DRAFT_525212 [Hyaloscypha sp. PMI_1271]
MDTNIGKEALKYIDTFGLDNTVKSKPVLGPTELVNAKKKRRDEAGSKDDDLDNDEVPAMDKSNNGLSAEGIDLYSDDNDTLEGVAATSRFKEDLRHFDTIYYKDMRLLVIRSPGGGERDVLAIEVTIAYYKGYKRRPKPMIFFFTEVDDLIFYPITYLVSLALIDGAFKAPSLTTPGRIFEYKV